MLRPVRLARLLVRSAESSLTHFHQRSKPSYSLPRRETAASVSNKRLAASRALRVLRLLSLKIWIRSTSSLRSTLVSARPFLWSKILICSTCCQKSYSARPASFSVIDPDTVLRETNATAALV